MSAHAHMDALHLLVKLGWQYLPRAQALAWRGSTRDVLLKGRLIEMLQTRRFDYKGESYALSPDAIDQIVRELSSPPLGDGLLAANERLYQWLTLGITVTESMPDGKQHRPTIPLIEWKTPAANAWDVTEACEVLSVQGTHHCTVDIVAYANGLPLVVIQTRSNEPANAVRQHLLNQHQDQIPQLYAYAQLLLSIGTSDGCYGTTVAPGESWARWREGEWNERHLRTIKSRPLPARQRNALLADKPEALRRHCEARWSEPAQVAAQDSLLAGLLKPVRLLEFLQSFVLFDRKAGKLVVPSPLFFGIRTLLARIRQMPPHGGREGGVLEDVGIGQGLAFFVHALMLDDGLKHCRVLVITDRIDMLASSAATTEKEDESTTGRGLARRIGQGHERVTRSSMQKFLTAIKLRACRNDSADLIVVLDEGTHDLGNEAHERMRKTLPKAAFVICMDKQQGTQSLDPYGHDYATPHAKEDAFALAVREPQGVYQIHETDREEPPLAWLETLPSVPIPSELEGHLRAQAFYRVLKLALDPSAKTEAAVCAAMALDIDQTVRTAEAEHSLSTRNRDAAIHQALLPCLFSLMGLDRARTAMDLIVRVVNTGLDST